jgi:hypothetical protein
MAHGMLVDRCEVLQDGSTLVLRLGETLVARVLQDKSGPRQGAEWFAKENAVAAHLTEKGAPMIPLHDGLPVGPHTHLGYPMNFWRFVTRVEAAPEPGEVGRALCMCHQLLRDLPMRLPELAILTECVDVLGMVEERGLFPKQTVLLLRERLLPAIDALRCYQQQPLHGDAHLGNVMNTTMGLLWTDWEDAFSGPVEWDLASALWNSQILEGDEATVNGVLTSYEKTGGVVNEEALRICMIARAVVMTAWYPLLYPELGPDRMRKLQLRLEWLEGHLV